MHENSNRRSTRSDEIDKVSTSDTVAQALTIRPGSTVAELAAATGLGRSTVGKVLAALEAAGAARRQPGGRDRAQRLPDRWMPASDPHTKTAAPGKATTAGGSATGRLSKGELGAMVVGYLISHPDDEVGPTVVARALNRSQGAVANALTKLVTTGEVELTSETPRRYRRAATA
ncbi:MarR family transcriptional regulator [Jatrophihabitans lederbergiae]|uniref:MarR family transcriptional regulator n=1 Tax=Jatrophihabitans lederbergiae TaxID=3075547 RepID=A0ABU2JFJ9_9ACTN|nr:MarR family transcriptional regulator [Jatrophihabitans sp. DSM 44399]MDT0263770.1 MarR family transcriptional regulator [Jatrophihabitans sp. DSM 44399]